MTELLFKMMLRDIFLDIVKYIPWTQGMCNEVVHIKQRSSTFLPDHFKAQEMCNEAVEADPYTLNVFLFILGWQRCVKGSSKNIYTP